MVLKKGKIKLISKLRTTMSTLSQINQNHYKVEKLIGTTYSI
jgi:hypothetical protein